MSFEIAVIPKAVCVLTGEAITSLVFFFPSDFETHPLKQMNVPLDTPFARNEVTSQCGQRRGGWHRRRAATRGARHHCVRQWHLIKTGGALHN